MLALEPLVRWPETRAWLLADLAEHRAQSSWDWEADARWATMTGDDAMRSCIDVLLSSSTIGMIKLNYHDSYVRRTITLPRLRALRRLVREGYAVARWTGTGEGSRALYGLSRVRVYELPR